MQAHDIQNNSRKNQSIIITQFYEHNIIPVATINYRCPGHNYRPVPKSLCLKTLHIYWSLADVLSNAAFVHVANFVTFHWSGIETLSAVFHHAAVQVVNCTKHDIWWKEKRFTPIAQWKYRPTIWIQEKYNNIRKTATCHKCRNLCTRTYPAWSRGEDTEKAV